jgi:hypothetical protein
MRKNGRRVAGAVFVAAWAWVSAIVGAGAAARAGTVYWSDVHNGAIYRTAGPGAAHELVVPDAGHPWGIAVDPINRHLYWGDNDASSARKITRSNYDGSGQVVVLSEDVVQGGGTQFVQSLSLDSVNNYIYYTEGNTRTIRRVRTDGGGEEVLVQGQLNGPVDVKLDTANGYMYWTQIISTHSELYRARLDGSEKQLLFTDQGFYYDLALAPDQGSGYRGEHIYFADQHPNAHGIRRIGIDGGNAGTLFSEAGLEPSGLEIDPVSGWIYWSRRDRPGIWRADLNGDVVEEVTDFAQFPANAYTIDFTLEHTALFAAGAEVPEPAGVMVLVMCGAAGLARRGRR